MKKLAGIRDRDMPHLVVVAASRPGGNLDMAMVAVARDGMLRASEIPRVLWRDVGYLPDGSAVLAVPHAEKESDRTGIHRRPLSPETVRILAALLPMGEDPSPTDRVFRLTRSQINRRIGALCRAAGLPGEYASSSPRIGQAEDLAEAGWTVESITAYGRWKTLDAAWHYVQRSRPSPALVVGTVVR